MGGVKRPAEGYREEPSEKKNLPVVAKTFVPRAAENRSPSAHLLAQTSRKAAGAAVQVTAGSASRFRQEGSGKVQKPLFFYLTWDHFLCC